MWSPVRAMSMHLHAKQCEPSRAVTNLHVQQTSALQQKQQQNNKKCSFQCFVHTRLLENFWFCSLKQGSSADEVMGTLPQITITHFRGQSCSAECMRSHMAAPDPTPLKPLTRGNTHSNLFTAQHWGGLQFTLVYFSLCHCLQT